VVIGGSAGIGLETARLARAEGAEVILTARDPARLQHAAGEVGALSAAAFDATDADRLERFFDGLRKPIDHPLLSASGPYYAPLAELDFARVSPDIDQHLLLPVRVRLHAVGNVRPRRAVALPLRHGRPPPRRRSCGHRGGHRRAPPAGREPRSGVRPDPGDLIGPGFVDTPLSASLLGDQLDVRRDQMRSALPIGRVVGPANVAALAVRIVSNTALTGPIYDVDGGKQLV
jgi:NAD(P)-dependent dehydrogenase (short-subunit alcohol dehydrogenase family)